MVYKIGNKRDSIQYIKRDGEEDSPNKITLYEHKIEMMNTITDNFCSFPRSEIVERMFKEENWLFFELIQSEIYVTDAYDLQFTETQTEILDRVQNLYKNANPKKGMEQFNPWIGN